MRARIVSMKYLPRGRSMGADDVRRVPNGTWFGVPSRADMSPPLCLLRQELGPTGDVYFYRLCAFCKEWAKAGCLADHWPAARDFIRFPGDVFELIDVCKRTGVVFGAHDALFLWDEYNGWLLRRSRKAAEKKAARRAAAKRAARTRAENKKRKK